MADGFVLEFLERLAMLSLVCQQAHPRFWFVAWHAGAKEAAADWFLGGSPLFWDNYLPAGAGLRPASLLTKAATVSSVGASRRRGAAIDATSVVWLTWS